MIDRVGTILLLLLFTTPTSAQAPARPRGADLERVEAYLRKVGAVGLESWLLERELHRVVAEGGDPKPIAVRLADALGRRLLDVDGAERRALDEKLDALLAEHPPAQTIALDVLRSEGEYRRGETLALKWVDEPDEAAAKTDATRLLSKVAAAMIKVRDQLLAEVGRGNESLAKLGATKNRVALERAVKENAELAGRAAYYAGWAGLYANLMGPMGPKGDAGFKDAQLSFRKLLDLEDLNQVPEADDVATDDPSQARVLLGLALAEMALGRTAQGRACFQSLRAETTHADVRDWVDFWEVTALLRDGSVGPAREVAEAALVPKALASPTPAKAALCKALVRRGTDDKDPQVALMVLGLRGLVGMEQFDLARVLVRAHRVDGTKVPGPLGAWVQGQTLFEKAETTRARADYEGALKAFQSALGDKDAEREAALGAVCRFARGCVLFRLDRDAEAHETLLAAADALSKLGLADAADAQWMAALVATRLAIDPASRAAARQELIAFREKHPTHPSNRFVNGLLERLVEKGTPPAPGETISLAQCRELFARWRRGDNATRAALREGLARAFTERLQLQTKGDDDEALDTRLMAIDWALCDEPPNVAQARQWLQEASSSKAAEEAGRALDLVSLRLRLARLERDDATARAAARTLVEKGRGTRHELQGRVALAKLADEDLAKSPADRAARAEALEHYRRIMGRLGTAPDRLRGDANAAAAATRLAELCRDEGLSEESARYRDSLWQAFPNDESATRDAARARYEAKRWTDALECWKRLGAAAPEGSDLWYEARIGQVECLARMDKDRARQAFQRLRALRPAPCPESWKSAWQRLEAELGPPGR